MDHLRRVLRSPVHFLLCTGAVIVAAGSAAVVFTFMNALWFRPASIQDPNSLVVVVHTSAPRAFFPGFSPGALAWFREMGVFDGIAGQLDTNNMAADLTPRLMLARVGRVTETLGVTEDYFRVLGVAVMGPGFSAEDVQPGAPPAVVISDGIWRRAYRADPSVIGSVVNASPFPVRIAGVAEAGFTGALRGEQFQIWLPYTQLPALAGATTLGNVIPLVTLCRMRSGATLASTRQAFFSMYASQGRPIADLEVVRLTDLFGAPGVPLTIIRNDQMIRLIGGMALLLVAAGCTTLIALLLVHYQHRQREMVVRVALGATRWDLFRQVAGELSLIVFVGIAGVLVVSTMAAGVLPHFTLPGGIDLGRLDLSPDWRVFLVVAITCVLLVGIAALFPVLRLARPGVAEELNASAATGTQRTLRMRRVILGVHAALTVLILITAGLFVQSAIAALTKGPGFDYDKTLFASVRMPTVRGLSAAATQAAYQRYGTAARDLLEAARAQPEIETAAIAGPPLDERIATRLDSTGELRTDDGVHDLAVIFQAVGPNYLEALGVPVLIGQAPTTPGELVVSATLAAEVWPDNSPIGRRLEFSGARGTVSGVVDMGFGSVRRGRPAMFLVFDAAENLPAALQAGSFRFVVHSAHIAEARKKVTALIRETFPDSPAVSVISGTELVEADLGQERLGAWFLSIVGTSAWLLGVASVFGLVGYVVECRRREFGVRMALGASSRNLLRLATWAGVEPTLAGSAFGLIAALWMSKLVEAFLIGIGGIDVPTYAIGFGLFVVSGATAGLIAAVRVRRIHPMQALRAE